MSRLIEDVKLALRFEECNTTARRFLGNEYPDKIEKYINIIKNHMVIKGTDNPIAATIEVSKLPVFEDGFVLMMLLSACYDLSTSE